MPRLAGLVIDQYDDADGRVIKTLHADPSDIPDFVKESARLDGPSLLKMADDRFALILVNGGQKLKKYAMVDKGNTALSVAYLLKQAHLLPPEAVKVAAANLIEACKHYGLGVPDELVKAAGEPTPYVFGKPEVIKAKSSKVIRLDFTGKEHADESTNSQLGKHDAANADVNQRTNMGGVQGTNFTTFPAVTEKEKTKEASVLDIDFRTRQHGTRYVDVTGWDPQTNVREDHVAPDQTLLGDKYPVDSYDQVKTAAAYFNENWKQFYPRDRREYCVKLAARMSELGIPVPDDVDRYASSGYAADAAAHVESRRALVSEEFHPALDTLLEKMAHVSPGTFAEALAEFDNISNVRWLWDAQVCDPWMSTFGPSLEKVAKADWIYNQHGVLIHEDHLDELALNHLSLVRKQFGNDITERFAKDPKGTFDALKPIRQLVLARMAQGIETG